MAETNTPDSGSGAAGRLLGPIVNPPGPHAAYAASRTTSRGRFYPERESATRSCYSRDRDRIIHSSAFRRLKHKTQVFVQHEGDYYRTRLTHSLEVAQLARSLARTLAADEDLAETVALAHDLGHTPFGHAGEEALDAVTKDIGGFDHNAHALRLVTKLEHRYADFDGLNLTWETLEGLVKHNGPLQPPLPGPIASFDKRWPLELSSWPGLEAQLAALADDIAYVSHDIDDGLRAGLFTIADLTARAAGRRSCQGRAGAAWRDGTVALHRRIDPYPDERADGRCAGHHPRQSARRSGQRGGGAGRGQGDGGLLAGAVRAAEGAQGVPDAEHVPPSPRSTTP